MKDSDPIWRPPSPHAILSRHEVHVWRASLDLTASHRESLSGISADELERAQRFHFEKDCARFIVARGLLRAILSRYLNVDPTHLRFHYTAYGKPALATGFSRNTLSFNLSHSDELALFAITHDREIGVDLERIRYDIADEQIAQRFFSPREIMSLRGLSVDRRSEMFFQYWTRKEAYLKARGEGLSFPLERFDVSLIRGDAAKPICLADDLQESADWHVQDLFAGAGYAAAIAVAGSGWRLSCWQWQR
jgi:4'-phosphopantetheinyl transferase